MLCYNIYTAQPSNSHQKLYKGDLSMNNWITYALSVAVLSTSVTAKSEIDDFGHSDHDAHTHGEVNLAIAKEGNKISIALESPSANLFGFEYFAESEAEVALVTQITAQLENANNLFVFNGSDCQSTEVFVDSSAVLPKHEKKHANHIEQDEHNHDKYQETAALTHSEIQATYQFQCNETSELNSIKTNLFNQFSGIENITVYWITDHKQGSVILSNNKDLILLN